MPSRALTSAASSTACRWISNAARRAADHMVLQRHRRTEYRHDTVAGELVDSSAISLHHVTSSGPENFGHQLTKALGAHGGGNLHRLHDIQRIAQ